MAKRFVDAGITTEQESMTLQDGSALTLTNTNGVRVLYEDALEKGQVVVLLERIKNAIMRLEPQ
jgi:hypothetical protein